MLILLCGWRTFIINHRGHNLYRTIFTAVLSRAPRQTSEGINAMFGSNLKLFVTPWFWLLWCFLWYKEERALVRVVWNLYFAFQSCAATRIVGNISQSQATQLGPMIMMIMIMMMMTMMVVMMMMMMITITGNPVRLGANITLTRARQKQSSGPRVEQYIGAQILTGPWFEQYFQNNKTLFLL